MTTLTNTRTDFHLSLFGRKYQLLFSEIVLIIAQRNYSVFSCCNGKKMMSSKSLGVYTGTLPDYLVRVNRSYIVNLRFIVTFEKDSLQLINGKRIKISRSRRHLIQEWLLSQTD